MRFKNINPVDVKSTGNKKKSISKLILFISLLPGFFLLIPVINLFIRSCLNDSSLNIFLYFFSSKYFLSVLWFTVIQATISSLFSVIIGLPIAFLYARKKIPFPKLFRSILSLSFSLPSIITILGFVIIYGNSGFYNQLFRALQLPDFIKFSFLYTPTAVILVHIFYNFPLTLRIVGDAIAHLPFEQEEAARILGASKIRIFLKIVLPRLLPSIAESFILGFLFCFQSFTVILVLGGGPSVTTLEAEIYRYAKFTNKLDYAGILACIELFVSYILTLLYFFIIKGRNKKELSIQFNHSDSTYKKKTSIPGTMYTILILFLTLGPIIGIIFSSFFKTLPFNKGLVFSIENYLKLFSNSNNYKVIFNTLILGLVSAFISIFFSLSALFYTQKCTNLEKSIINFIYNAPLTISSVFIGLSWSIFFKSDITFLLLPLILALPGIPFAFRSLSQAYKKIPVAILEASTILCKSKIKITFSIIVPLLTKTIIGSFLYSFLLAIGEINSLLLFAPQNTETLPLRIFHLIGSYRFNEASAYASILILVSIVLFVLSEKEL